MSTSQQSAKLQRGFGIAVGLTLFALSSPFARATVTSEIQAQLDKLPPANDAVVPAPGKTLATSANLILAFNKAVGASATTKANASLYVSGLLAVRTTDRNILAPLLVTAAVNTAGATANAASIAKITAAAISTASLTTASTVANPVALAAFKFPAAAANKQTFTNSVVGALANGTTDATTASYFVKSVISSGLKAPLTAQTLSMATATAVKAKPILAAGTIAGGVRALTTGSTQFALVNQGITLLGATTTNVYNLALYSIPGVTTTNLTAFTQGIAKGFAAALPAATKESLKGQLAKGAIQGSPANALTIVNAIVATGGITNYTTFATTAASAVTSAAPAGVVAKALAVKFSGDSAKVTFAKSVINGILSSTVRPSVATEVAKQVASLAALKPDFAGLLAQGVPTYAAQIAVGVASLGSPELVTKAVILKVPTTSAAAVAGAVTGATGFANASKIALEVGKTFTSGSYAAVAPAIAKEMAKNLANTTVGTLDAIAEQIGDVAAILAAQLPANNGAILLDIVTQIASVTPRTSLTTNLADFYQRVAYHVAAAAFQLGGDATLLGNIQAKFFAVLTDATVQTAISTAITNVVSGGNNLYTRTSSYISIQETPFANH